MFYYVSNFFSYSLEKERHRQQVGRPVRRFVFFSGEKRIYVVARPQKGGIVRTKGAVR